MTMKQAELDQVRSLFESGRMPTSVIVAALIETAQAAVDMKLCDESNEMVVVARCEYDWLVQRSHRLEGLEL